MEKKSIQLICVLIGFMIGALYIYFCGGNSFGGNEMLGLQSIIGLAYSDIQLKKYLIYLLKRRIGIIIFVGVMALTSAGNIFMGGFCLFFGIGTGSMISVAIMHYGIKGILVFLAFTMPQMLFYIPAFSRWITWFSELRLGLHKKRKKQFDITYYETKKVVKYKFLIGMLVFTIIGLLVECYVNPFFVKKIIKIL